MPRRNDDGSIIKWALKWAGRIMVALVVLYIAAGTKTGTALVRNFMPDFLIEYAQTAVSIMGETVNKVDQRISKFSDEEESTHSRGSPPNGEADAALEENGKRAKEISKAVARHYGVDPDKIPVVAPRVGLVGEKSAYTPDTGQAQNDSETDQAGNEFSQGKLRELEDRISRLGEAGFDKAALMEDMAQLWRFTAYLADIERRILASEGYDAHAGGVIDKLEHITEDSVKRAKELETITIESGNKTE